MTELQFSELGKLFDTQEKWDAFLELWYVKDNLRNHWYDETVLRVRELCEAHADGDAWVVNSGYYWIRLSPRETGLESLSIHIDFSDRNASLWINANLFDAKNISTEVLANGAMLLPCLPGFVYNNHPWCPMLKAIPSDIINYEADWKTFDSFMYKWAHSGGAIAEKIFSEFFEPVLNANVAELFSRISSKAKTTI